MKLSRFVALAALTTACAIQAKTPATRVQELSAFMPTGQKARMAWMQGGTWRSPGNTREIYVMDSDDGVIRTITTDIAGWAPFVTHDGSRVVYGEKRSSRIYVHNFDGSGTPRVVGTSGINLVGYWFNPTSKEEFVYHLAGSSRGHIRRTNIATNATEVVWSNTVAEGSPWIGISPDGTRMAARFTESNCPGVAVIPNGALSQGPCGGCGIDISPDSRYCFFAHWDASYKTGHHAMRIYCGSQVTTIDTRPVYDLFNGQSEYKDARWTTHPDFMTFSWINGNKGPFIYNLTKKTFVYIEDYSGSSVSDGNTYADHLHVRFLPKGSTTVGKARSRHLQAGFDVAQGRIEAYTTTGRRVKSLTSVSKSPTTGVVVVRGKQEIGVRAMLLNKQ